MPAEPEPEEEMHLDLLNVQSALQLQVNQDVILLQFVTPCITQHRVMLLQTSDRVHDAVVKEMCGPMERVLAFYKMRDQSRDRFSFYSSPSFYHYLL